MARFSRDKMKAFFFNLVSVLPKQSSSRSEIVDPELALNWSPSSSGAREESSAAVAAVGSSESTPEDDPSRSLGGLAVPAIVSVAIYGSIPPAVHLDHLHAPLYEPLVAFICLAVFVSLGDIIWVLLRPGARGVGLLMGLSIVFLLVAFLLRIMLLV